MSAGRKCAWRPRHNEWFDAYDRRYRNHRHPAGPFRRTRYYSSAPYSQYVEGVDADGNEWVFSLTKFRLEPASAAARRSLSESANADTKEVL